MLHHKGVLVNSMPVAKPPIQLLNVSTNKDTKVWYI